MAHYGTLLRFLAGKMPFDRSRPRTRRPPPRRAEVEARAMFATPAQSAVARIHAGTYHRRGAATPRASLAKCEIRSEVERFDIIRLHVDELGAVRPPRAMLRSYSMFLAVLTEAGSTQASGLSHSLGQDQEKNGYDRVVLVWRAG